MSSAETANEQEAESEKELPKLVFVSHSSKDKAIAARIVAAIEERGVGAWIAPRDVTPGIAYGQSIINGINGSRVMVVVLSASANASGAVHREIERAFSKGCPVIPFRIEDVLPCEELEFFISSSHWLDAWEGPLDKHVAKLADYSIALANDDRSALRRVQQRVTAKARDWLSSFVDLFPQKFRPSRRQALIVGGSALAVAAAAGVWRLTAAPTVDSSALAVLPFENLVRDAALDYLSLAIPAELNSWLANASSVIVRPLDAARRFAGAREDIAQALRVGTIVSGKYWQADGAMHISVDIIDTRRNETVWTQTAEDEADDIQGLVNRVLRSVQTALSIRLQEEQPNLGTTVPNAYTLFLQALALNQDVTEASNSQMIALLRRAIEADANFARAHALLGEAYITRFWWNFSQDREWIRLGDAAAREAVRLAPSLAEARFALGYAQEVSGKRGDAVRGYFASLRLGPQSTQALANVARYYFYMGEFARAIETLERLAIVDPTYNIHVRKAMCHFFGGNAGAAARENAQAERMAHGVDQLTLVAFTYCWLRDFPSAERVLAAMQQQSPGAFSIREVMAWLHTMKGQYAQALPLMQGILTERPSFGIRDEVATLYAVQGDVARAVPMLQQAVREGAPNYAWYKSDFFRSARRDRRYQALMESMAQEYQAALADVRP